MRVPTPRLRQVFEHTTHFRVTSPKGNPIVIAKKGLSPRMVQRLQAFAKGGEVGHYADGVEVKDDAELAKLEADFAKIQANADRDLASALAPTESDEIPAAELVGPPAPPRKPFTGEGVKEITEADVLKAEEERIAAAKAKAVQPAFATPPSIEPPPTETERARLAASAAPAPAAAPVVVNVNAAPATAPVEKPALKAEAASVAAAPAEEVKAKAAPKTKKTETPASAPAPAAEMPALQLRRPALDRLPAPAPAVFEPTPLDAGLLTPPLAEPKFASTAIIPTAPIAAPVVAPTPAVEPLVAPAPTGLALGTPTTGKAVAEEMSKNKTLLEAIAATTGTDDVYKAFTPTELKGIEAAQKQYGDAVPKMLIEATVTRANGAIAQAKVDKTAATAQRDELKQLEIQAATKAKADYDAEQAALVHAKELRDNAEKNTDLKSFFESEGLAKSIFSIISLAIGGALSGYTNTPNYVLRAFNKAMERDIEEQKRRINSRWNLYKDATNSAEAATALVKADNLILADIAMKRAKANQNLAGVAPQLNETLGKLETELALNLSKFSGAAAREEYLEKIGAAAGKPRVSVRVTKDSGKPTIGEQRLEFAKARYEQGKRFSVPDPADPTKSIFISASSEQTAKRVIPELQQRVDGIMRVEDFSNWLKENANNPVSPESIKQMQTKIAGIVENYPGIAKGAKSLVTVAQAKLLKPAITSTTIPILQFMDVLGLTSTAMNEIRNDAARGVMTSIKTAAAENDAGAKEFLSKWTPAGYRGRTGYAAESLARIPATGVAIPGVTSAGDIRSRLKPVSQ